MKTMLFLLILSFTFNAPAQLSVASKLEEVAQIRKSDCDSAFSVLSEMEVGNSDPAASNYHLEMGLTYYCLGKYRKALQSYQTSLELFKSQSDVQKSVEILNLIGTLQKKQGNPELAKDYFNQGLEYAKQHNDSIGIGNSLNNLGVLNFELENYQESLDLYLHSTAVKSAIGDTLGLSYNYDNLGMVYTQLGVFDSARYYFDLAAHFKQLIGDEVGYAIVKNNIGELLIQQGNWSLAEPYFQEALGVAQKVSFPDFEQHVLGMISRVHEERENYKEALSFFKQQVKVKDSLFNKRKSQQVAELETKYQTEQKEATIKLQEAEIKQKNFFLYSSIGVIALLFLLFMQYRKQAVLRAEKLLEEHKRKAREAEIKAAIASQEQERSRYARDLHDGFGQMISILNMNLENLKEGAKPKERQKVFEESSKVIDDMYDELKNICFDLMPQTLIKNGLESALREFTDRINQAGKVQVELNVFGLEGRLSELQEISLYRIAQEWINNVLKYSNAAKITLQITKDDDEITLLIEDDGDGFDKNRLFESKGNGWKNLNTRSNLIQGDLELETELGRKGNTLIVNAPSKTISSEVPENTVRTV